MSTPKENEKLLLDKLRRLVTNIKWSPEQTGDLFNALLKRFHKSGTDRSRLVPWMMDMMHRMEINYITPSWGWRKDGKTCLSALQLVHDTSVTDETLRTRLADDREKQLDDIITEIGREKINQIDETFLDEVRKIVSAVNGVLVKARGSDESKLSGLGKDLLRLCRAVENTKRIRPRLTQMVSWCIMALSDTGQLIQVGTGEGKSCIVAMFAAFRALRGQKVDVMSSSPVLAERDLEEWSKFYKDLKISVACNTNKHGVDFKKCYGSQVVYGTVEQFAGHWLQQHFHRSDIFGQRTFQCAIVDEVDSLMLDKGLHVVYLSSDMPALQHLNPLLALIWATTNQYAGTSAGSRERVEEEVKKHLRFTPCDLSKDKSTCYVPGFLSDLVKSKLTVWIENAFRAQKMTMDHEYVLESHGVVPVDYKCTGVVENFMEWSDGLHQFLEMKHKSKLSDMTVITNYMSNVGLLQKYGNQIFGMSGTLGQQTETETLQKIYDGIRTCRIPTFKRRKLFEVEGMVLNDEEEWKDQICMVVTEQVESTASRKQRAVLVICETISRAKTLHTALGDRVTSKKLYINNNMDNTAIFEKMVEAGEVIIATNLAGRGTDLKVSDDVNKAGGLFVVQTFLPNNTRVEEQAFGRTARQGSPGCAQLIICSSHLPQTLQLLILTGRFLSLFTNILNAAPLYENLFVSLLRSYQQNHTDEHDLVSLILTLALTKNSKSELETAKELRDALVAEGLASYLDCDIPKIKKKQELFSHYLSVLNDVYKSNNRPAQSELSALNEFWGMWLLTDFAPNKSVEELKSSLSTALDRARRDLRQRRSPSSNLHHYTVFGNKLREQGHLADSIKTYSKAIEQDHCWAAIAFYNRAFAALTQQDKQQDRNCIDQALQDLHNALQSVELYCDQIEVTQRFSTKQINEHHSVRTTRFHFHISARYRVLQFLISNIKEAIMKVDRARDLGGNVKVDEHLVYFLAPPVHFVPLALLSTESVTQIYSRDPLKMQQLIKHPAFDFLNELRCLESLGLTHIYTLDTLFSLGGFFSNIQRKLRLVFD